MSKSMESKPATSSVIARLMCLDELQSRQPVDNQKKQRRVLSENYMRKVASIGAWEKTRSFDKRSSFRLSNEEHRELKDAYEAIESLETDKESYSRKGISLAQVKERQNLSVGVKSVTYRSIRSFETRDVISDVSLEPQRLGFSGAYGLTNEPEFTMVSDVNDRCKPSYVAHQEGKQQVAERWRKTKEFWENGLAIGDRGRSRTLPSRAGPSGISSRDGWKNEGVADLIKSRSQIYSTSFGSPYITMKPVFPWSLRKSINQVSSRKDCPKQRNPGTNYKRSRSSPGIESEKSAEQSSVREMSNVDCVVPESSAFSAASLSIVSEQQVESAGCTLSEKDRECSVCIPDAWSSQEDISTKISKECSIDPEFLVNLETATHPSPVSVLEAPFAEGSIIASLNDVKRQLEFIKSKSIEEYSEGPGMFVSSDDENDAGEESLKDKWLFALAETRDFSYLVDALTANGWRTLETPISPSVFETLEKKYGEQVSWRRCSRRLLFDRINSALTGILQPCLGDPMWTKPVARRLSYSKNSKDIEEEMYMLLVSQENEAKKKSSEKVFGKDDGWLSLGYEIEVIGREIENSLIDELVAEIVSI